MLENKKHFDEELKLLTRALRQPELFRFIILQYNHHGVIGTVEETLHKQFPERPLLRLRISDEDYYSLIEKITGHRGIIMVEDFDRLLDDPGLYIGFNQRRDKLSGLPVQLLCFLPPGQQHLRNCMEKIKDWWSIRNLLVFLESPPEAIHEHPALQEQRSISSLGGHEAKGKRQELARLTKRIKELETAPGTEATGLLHQLYPQALTILKDLGEYKKGLELSEKWLALASHSLSENSLDYANILSEKATFLKYLAEFSEAKKLYKNALVIAQSSDDEQKIAVYQNNLALVLQALGDYAGAKGLLEKALASDEKNFGPGHPTTAVSYSNLAMVLEALGDYAGAKELLEKTIISAEKNYGEEHPQTAIYYSNLALVLKDLGDYAGAKGLLEKALASDEKNFGPGHPTTAVSYSNLATVLKDLGDYAGAKGLLEKALASDEKNFGPGHPTTAVSYSNLALVLQALGDYAGAKGLLEKALASDEKNFGPGHPTTAVRYSNLALVLKDLGDYAGALSLAYKALKIFKKVLPEGHPYIDQMEGNVQSIEEAMKGK